MHISTTMVQMIRYAPGILYSIPTPRYNSPPSGGISHLIRERMVSGSKETLLAKIVSSYLKRT